MVKEKDIIAWRNYNDLSFLQCACKLTEQVAVDEADSKRQEMKALVNNFRKINPHIDMNIFKSTANVNLDTVVGYRKAGEYHNFINEYDCP